jgi:hypothetical protein
MASIEPLWVSAATAAKMLELPLSVFNGFVENGLLPKGREIVPGHVRFEVEKLRRVLRGDAVDGMSDVDWGG